MSLSLVICLWEENKLTFDLRHHDGVIISQDYNFEKILHLVTNVMTEQLDEEL